MYINTKGLVLRETPYKESSRILTVLTSDLGKVTVSARGTKRKGSKTASSTQFSCFFRHDIVGKPRPVHPDGGPEYRAVFRACL